MDAALLLSQVAFGVPYPQSQLVAGDRGRRIEQLQPEVGRNARWRRISEIQRPRKTVSAAFPDQLGQAVTGRRTAGSEQADDEVTVQLRICGSNQRGTALVKPEHDHIDTWYRRKAGPTKLVNEGRLEPGDK